MLFWATFILFFFTGGAWVLSLAFRHDYYAETNTTYVRAYLILKACFWIGLVATVILFLVWVKNG